MWIPFSKQFATLFESDRRFPLKLLGGALFGLVTGMSFSIHDALQNEFKDVPLFGYVLGVAASVVVSVVLVAAMCLKDTVRNRIASGQPVSPLLRLLFARGYLSFAIWVWIAIVTAFAIMFAWF